MKNNYLFNFSVSWTGGGLKRLYAYSEWFDKKGGTNYIPTVQILLTYIPIINTSLLSNQSSLGFLRIVLI